MGFWEDVEVLEGENFEDKKRIFLDYFQKKDLTKEENFLLRKLRGCVNEKEIKKIIKQLFIFKKKTTGNFIHKQFVSEEEFCFGNLELNKTLRLLKKKFGLSHKSKRLSFFKTDDIFIALIKIQNSNKKELIEKMPTNKKTNLTRSIIVEKRKLKLNLFFRQGLFTNRQLNKILREIKLISNIFSLDNISTGKMDEEFNKILSFENLEGIKFKETKLSKTPRMGLESILPNQNIKEALQKVREFLFEDARYILSFKLRLSSLLSIKIKRTLKRIKKGEKDIGIRYNFCDKNLKTEDLNFLTNNGIRNNLRIISEDSKLNLSQQINRLFLNNGCLFWLDTLLCQKARNLLEKEKLIKNNDEDSFEINFKKVENKILSFFKREKYRSKKITGLYKLNSNAISLYLMKKQNISFYISIIKTNDLRSIKSVLDRCRKVDANPIFICLSECNKLKENEFVQILFGDMIENEKTFRIDEKIIPPYYSRNKERVGKNIREGIEKIELLIKKTPKNFGNSAEFHTGEILRLFFPSAQKLGGRYIPDGITFIDDNGSVSVWDSKYWINSSFCNNKIEIKKLQRYIDSSDRSKKIKGIGNFKKFWIIGKIDFKNFKKLKSKVKMPKGVVLDYLDFDLLKRLVQIYLKISNEELFGMDFFKVSRKIIFKKNFKILKKLEEKISKGRIIKEIVDEADLRKEFEKDKKEIRKK